MEKSILKMVGGEKYINPHYDIKVAKKYTTLQEHIAELEKENAKLKDKNKALELYADLADGKVAEVKLELFKAKKIIENLLNAFVSNDFF